MTPGDLLAKASELEAQAAALIHQAHELRQEARRLRLQATVLEARQGAATLEVGMTVCLRGIPEAFMYAPDMVLPDTPLRIERVYPKSVLLSRVDGGNFPPLHGGKYVIHYQEYRIETRTKKLLFASRTSIRLI